nr:hypothetical protein BaRGS_006145 [Batillaria attramentaria]
MAQLITHTPPRHGCSTQKDGNRAATALVDGDHISKNSRWAAALEDLQHKVPHEEPASATRVVRYSSWSRM